MIGFVGQLCTLWIVGAVEASLSVWATAKLHDVNKTYIYRRILGQPTQKEPQNNSRKALTQMITHTISFFNVIRSRTIEFKRVNDACTENINIFFDRLDQKALVSIKLENLYNADDYAIMIGFGDNGVVIGDAFRELVFNKGLKNLE
ncbi:hypothetical protein GGS21DRAFT_487414 [Xylaria nigripes]|nr:hypothetical protein GGS21DRAFT_487414 [Xylaria nigripes]